jgi:hypothetical protein
LEERGLLVIMWWSRWPAPVTAAGIVVDDDRSAGGGAKMASMAWCFLSFFLRWVFQ